MKQVEILLWIIFGYFWGFFLGYVICDTHPEANHPDPLRTELDSLRTELDIMRVKYDAIRNELIRCEGREVGREMARNLAKNSKL